MNRGRRKGGRHDERKRKDRRFHAEPGQRPDTPVRIVTPPRVKAPPLPPVTLEPRVGKWLWTTRAGFEPHLFEELAWAKLSARLLGPALLESDAPRGSPPAFGRMGFPVAGLARDVRAAQRLLPPEGAKVQVWVPDTPEGNARSGEAAAWEEALAGLRAGAKDLETPWQAFEAGGWLAQVCLFAPGVAAVGQVRARAAVSLAAGGRQRMRRTEDAPSRAAMKLDEALEWFGNSPGRGEVCVDLGSAPGGWTRRLVERGARVWSVDPANLAPDLEGHGRVKHFKVSAFDFEPDEPVDWLFCDMAWRPLEVAQLLGKWARRRLASQLIANFKLPMNDKLPMVFRVRQTLESAGWSRVRIRQLYHDRDEVTVSAISARGTP